MDMATLSLRIRDDLKRKTRSLAERQGVSLNNFINAVLAASIAQEEILAFFNDRLKDVDLVELHRRVVALMRETQPGTDPTIEDLQGAMGDRF
jgi:antitoxin component of RelBE/YafQ-DinJ toxin-antitoxin module